MTMTTDGNSNPEIIDESTGTINGIGSNDSFPVNTERRAGRPKGSKNKAKQNEPEITQPTPSGEDGEFQPDHKADNVEKHEAPRSKRSRKQSDKMIKQLLTTVFETENKLLQSVNPDLKLSSDSIELMAETGSQCAPQVMDGMSDTKFCALVFASSILMAHAPIAIEAVKHMQRNKRNKNQKQRLTKMLHEEQAKRAQEYPPTVIEVTPLDQPQTQL